MPLPCMWFVLFPAIASVITPLYTTLLSPFFPLPFSAPCHHNYLNHHHHHHYHPLNLLFSSSSFSFSFSSSSFSSFVFASNAAVNAGAPALCDGQRDAGVCASLAQAVLRRPSRALSQARKGVSQGLPRALGGVAGRAAARNARAQCTGSKQRCTGSDA